MSYWDGTYTPPTPQDLANYEAYAHYLDNQDPAIREALDAEFYISVPSKEEIDAVITDDFLAEHSITPTSPQNTDVLYGGSGLFSTRYSSYLDEYWQNAATTSEICEAPVAKSNTKPPSQPKPSSGIEHLQNLLIGDNGYYTKTLSVLNHELAGSSVSGVPEFAVDLFAAFLQGSLSNNLTSRQNLNSVLDYWGVDKTARSDLIHALGIIFVRGLAESYKIDPQMLTSGSIIYQQRFAAFTHEPVKWNSNGSLRDGNPQSLNPEVRNWALSLLQHTPSLASALSQTEQSNYDWFVEMTGLQGSSEPFAKVHQALREKKSHVEASIARAGQLGKSYEIASLIKSFEGDARDVDWIYTQLGIPKNPENGKFLVDEIYESFSIGWDWRNARPELESDFRTPQFTNPQTWMLAFGIAKQKKLIDLGEIAFQAFAIGASIAATIAGGVIAGPPGAMVAGTTTAGIMGITDVSRADARLDTISAANAAHHMANLPLGRDEHLEIVSEAKDYAVQAATAGVLLSILGAGASSELTALSKAVFPGSKLAALGLNTVLQGFYGALDGGAQAALDGRVTRQDYLDRSTALARPGQEAPSWVEGLVYSVTIGAAFGAGSELAFGGLEIVCRFNAEAPEVIDPATGRTLSDYSISDDGHFLVGPDGRRYPLQQEGSPKLIIKNHAVGNDSSIPESVVSRAYEMLHENPDQELTIMRFSDGDGYRYEVHRGGTDETTSTTFGDPEDFGVIDDFFGAVPLAHFHTGTPEPSARDLKLLGARLRLTAMDNPHAVMEHTVFGTDSHGNSSQITLRFTLSTDGQSILLETPDAKNVSPETLREIQSLWHDIDVQQRGMTPHQLQAEAGLAFRQAPDLRQNFVSDFNWGDTVTLWKNGEPDSGWEVVDTNDLDETITISKKGRTLTVKPHQIENDTPTSPLNDSPQVAQTTPAQSSRVGMFIGFKNTQELDIINPDGSLDTGWKLIWTHEADGTLELTRGNATRVVSANDVIFHENIPASRYAESAVKTPASVIRTLSQGELRQTNVGNCYLAAALDCLRKFTGFESLMSRSLKINADGSFTLKIPLSAPDGVGTWVNVFPEDLTPSPSQPGYRTSLGEGKVYDTRTQLEPLEGPKIVQILEAAFIKYSLGVTNPQHRITASDRLALEGGASNTVLSLLFGDNAIKYNIGNSNNNKPLIANETLSESIRFLSQFDATRTLATVSTRTFPEIRGGDKFLTVRDIHGNDVKIFMQHAYTVTKVDSRSKTLTIANPWASDSKIYTLDFEAFLATFYTINAVRL